MKDVCFFTWFTENYASIGNVFVKSFKKFHPDIELFVLRDDEIKKVFSKDSRLSFKNNKATMAKLFYNDYRKVVCVDADHFVFDRLTSVIEDDYELGAAANFNIATNIELFAGTSPQAGNKVFIDKREYVNGGIIASNNKFFWDSYEYASLTKAKEFSTYDNDILNIIWHTSSYKKKVFDGDYMFDNPAHNSYYGCSILPYEVIPGTVTIKDNKIHCNGKPVKLYHLATGRTPHKQPIKEIFPPHTHAVIDDILN